MTTLAELRLANLREQKKRPTLPPKPRLPRKLPQKLLWKPPLRPLRRLPPRLHRPPWRGKMISCCLST